ncbi:MAG: hypothetical protein ABIS36_14945 [Chryseolinea sp.]
MKADQKVWFKWMFNYSIGELTGIGAAAIVGRLLFISFNTQGVQPAFLTTAVLIMAGASEGLIIGYIQWKSLSRLVSNFKPTVWIITTSLSAIAGWLLILPPAIVFISFLSRLHIVQNSYLPFYAGLAGLAFGGVMGIPQFFIIRKFYKASVGWIMANALGWMFSFLVVYGALQMFSDHSTFYNVVIIVGSCILSGFVQGVITGTLLHFIMSARKEHEVKGLVNRQSINSQR